MNTTNTNSAMKQRSPWEKKTPSQNAQIEMRQALASLAQHHGIGADVAERLRVALADAPETATAGRRALHGRVCEPVRARARESRICEEVRARARDGKRIKGHSTRTHARTHARARRIRQEVRGRARDEQQNVTVTKNTAGKLGEFA